VRQPAVSHCVAAVDTLWSGLILSLTRARISGGVLTITGHGLKGVAKVEVNANGCNPGSGTDVPLGAATKTDTKITVPFGGNFTVGTNVILSSPLGPSSSCSSPCTTASACPF
jgi:hypothetical protein